MNTQLAPEHFLIAVQHEVLNLMYATQRNPYESVMIGPGMSVAAWQIEATELYKLSARMQALRNLGMV
jgi:hypothetical protein